MFKTLQKKIGNAFRVLKGNNKITEINVSIVLKEIGKALIDADVNHKVVSEFIKKVKNKYIGKNVLDDLNPKQLIIKLVHDELVSIMGGKKVDINISKNPSIILLFGLQGSGKTSFSSKLSLFLKKKGKNPLLVAADIYRPAAIDQLNALANKINVPVFSLKENKNVIDIIKKSIPHAYKNKNNIIIIDTAGRLAVDDFMMKEIQQINNNFDLNEKLFVVDSMTGQDAINTAKNFSNLLNFDGIVITKLDGDSKGGVAITISSVTKKPIKFISIGEKMDDIEIFYPDRMANRILGMGDVVSFVEKVQEQFDEKKTNRIYNKISKNKFNFYDLLDQVNRIKKMGSIKNIISMIPGMEKFFLFDKKENSFKRIETIILSMTPDERKNPKLFDDINRRIRLSKGSGYPLKDIDMFFKQFYNMNKVLKKINTSGYSGKQIIKDFLSKMINKSNNI
ncbi:signal recognition particle protein [Blattabacterium cuenoti]|uniref:signal recognition particle protein n=1 Tax=Blattabacterium cuenoti TaxID=1653831 RepID=UPI00163C63C3|nr:signal recognition particle protein [Blattabacterium cuenoti]